jgi:hypothetical protein
VNSADPFDDLGARLRRRPMPALPAGLRDHVLADVVVAPERAPIVDWRFAASLAAAVLVGLNVAAMASHSVAGLAVPRLLPPAGVSVTSTDSAAVASRFGSPWLPCDLPGGR